MTGHPWTGAASMHASRGHGLGLMNALWADIDQRLGDEGFRNGLLRCVLTVDDIENPQELVWQIVRLEGEAAISITLKAQVFGVDGRAPYL